MEQKISQGDNSGVRMQVTQLKESGLWAYQLLIGLEDKHKTPTIPRRETWTASNKGNNPRFDVMGFTNRELKEVQNIVD